VIRSAAKSLEDEMTRHALRFSLLPLTLCVLAACDRNPPPPPDAASPATAQTSATAPATAPAATSDAGGAPSIPSHTPAVDMGASSQAAAAAPAAEPGAGSIDFDLPKAWKSETPKSGMRLAQASIPGAKGAADFAVFYFGPGGGGPVEANIARWVGQMEGTGPKPVPEMMEANGYKITWVDAKGTMKGGQMGMGPATAIPAARLYGAVVEGPGGPWFFKAQGPDSTLGSQRDAFVTMLKSVRAKK
jgi:hypothetical protein